MTTPEGMPNEKVSGIAARSAGKYRRRRELCLTTSHRILERMCTTQYCFNDRNCYCSQAFMNTSGDLIWCQGLRSRKWGVFSFTSRKQKKYWHLFSVFRFLTREAYPTNFLNFPRVLLPHKTHIANMDGYSPESARRWLHSLLWTA